MLMLFVVVNVLFNNYILHRLNVGRSKRLTQYEFNLIEKLTPILLTIEAVTRMCSVLKISLNCQQSTCAAASIFVFI